MRVWLQEGHDDEPGVEAWALDLLGFATWAPSPSEVVKRLPHKLALHAAWLRRHGLRPPSTGSRVEVVEHVFGNEILFRPDEAAATPAEIDHTVQLLRASRSDLLGELAGVSDGLLDWDPPYRRFAPWASWRSVRATLAHIANGESHYYLRNIGYRSPFPPAVPEDDWQLSLSRSREHALRFLEGLKSSVDLARISTSDHGAGDERWSVRKALRRMVRHELLHEKSIRRIRRAYEQAHGEPPARPTDRT